jgi:prepilin-type processing-associated H-X9-DG protein
VLSYGDVRSGHAATRWRKESDRTMKTEARRLEALTLIEVLVIIAILFVLAAMLLPSLSNGDRHPRRVVCLSQLKTIGRGFVMWPDDHNGQFPWQIPASNGGTLEFIYTGHTFPHYEKLSKYVRQPETFLCPSDKAKHAVTNYAALSDQSVSYFLNVDLSTNSPSASIVAGDRNLQANGKPVQPGLFTLTTNLDMNWTHEAHDERGNLAFADGHAESVKTNRLNELIQSRSPATNRLAVP